MKSIANIIFAAKMVRAGRPDGLHVRKNIHQRLKNKKET